MDCDAYEYNIEEINNETWWKENPDGFVWDCCEKRGTNAGCTRGPHRAFSGQRRRFGDEMSDCPNTESSDESESQDDVEQDMEEEAEEPE